MKKILLFIATLFLAFGFNSCEKDFLELEPSFAISETDAFTSIDKANAVLISAYNYNSYYMCHGLYFFVVPEVMGDDVFVKANGNYNWFVHDYKYTTLSSYSRVSDMWEYFYKVIQASNQIIANVPGIVGDPVEKASLRGQAFGLRAMAYFNLVRMYSMDISVDPNAPGVPLRLTPANASSEAPGRGTVQDVYDQVLMDADSAIAYAPEFTESATFSVDAGHALAARVNLYLKNYAEAAAHARETYANHPLMSIDEMLEGIEEPRDEWIWSLEYTPDDNSGYPTLGSFYDNRTLGYSSLRADVDFLALIDINVDLRKDWWERDAGDWVLSQDGGKFTKFPQSSNQDQDEVMYRSTEMYLIEAEALARQGLWTLAQDALWFIQERAKPTSVKSTNTDQTLIDEILLERRIELIGEGHRLFDLNRLNMPLERGSSAWPEVLKDLPANDPLMIFPIPQDEIDSNPNISDAEQNEDY